MPKAKEPKDAKVKVSVLPKMPPVANYNQFTKSQGKVNNFTPRVFRVTQHKG